VFARRAPATRNGIPGFLEEADLLPSLREGSDARGLRSRISRQETAGRSRKNKVLLAVSLNRRKRRDGVDGEDLPPPSLSLSSSIPLGRPLLSRVSSRFYYARLSGPRNVSACLLLSSLSVPLRRSSAFPATRLRLRKTERAGGKRRKARAKRDTRVRRSGRGGAR